TRFSRDWSSDVCSSDLLREVEQALARTAAELERVRGERAAAAARQRELAAETARVEARLGDERAALAEQLRMTYMAGRAEAVKRSEERRVGREGGAREE